MPTGTFAEPGVLPGGVVSIAATLEEDIVLGLLAPKVRLVEDDLMSRFSAKRHMVREALSLLETAGLVVRKRNVGALVKEFAREEVIALYEMRQLLEVEAMRKIPLPMTTDTLNALKAIQKAHDDAILKQDARHIFRTNQAFHRHLFSQCGNTYLAQAIEDFARKTHAIRFGALVLREHQLRSQQEHHAMLIAFEQGNRTRLLELAATHLEPSRDHYLKAQAMLGSVPQWA